MNRIHRRTAIAGAVAACALAFSAAPASAAPNTATNTAPNTATNTYANTTTHATRASSDDLQDANQHVKQALDVVRKMDSDPHIKTLLKQSLGVFVVPDYGRASFVVGGQGGAGVLLTHRNGRWGGPAFYNLGGVSLGAQAGVSGGHIAMVLMDQKALDSFGQNNKFSLNADAGLTIIDASARGHATAGHGDVVMWTDTAGLSGNLSVSVTDIHYDAQETRAYYGHDVAPATVMAGDVKSPKAADLLQALPS